MVYQEAKRNEHVEINNNLINVLSIVIWTTATTRDVTKAYFFSISVYFSLPRIRLIFYVYSKFKFTHKKKMSEDRKRTIMDLKILFFRSEILLKA